MELSRSKRFRINFSFATIIIIMYLARKPRARHLHLKLLSLHQNLTLRELINFIFDSSVSRNWQVPYSRRALSKRERERESSTHFGTSFSTWTTSFQKINVPPFVPHPSAHSILIELYKFPSLNFSESLLNSLPILHSW